MLPYLANTVSVYANDCMLMIVFTPICDNERVVFLQMKLRKWLIPHRKHYIYNSLLISWN